jgi:hypothetical protein
VNDRNVQLKKKNTEASKSENWRRQPPKAGFILAGLFRLFELHHPLSPFPSTREGPSMNRSGPAHKITPPARPGSILALSPTTRSTLWWPLVHWRSRHCTCPQTIDVWDRHRFTYHHQMIVRQEDLFEFYGIPYRIYNPQSMGKNLICRGVAIFGYILAS